MPSNLKKKRVRKFSGEEGSLVKSMVPAQIRTFLGTLSGNRDPITEKDFTADELKQVRDAITKSRERQTGKRFIASGTPGKKDYKLDQYYDPTVDYKDYGKDMNSGRQDLNVGSGAAMRNTLGKFSYEKTPEGRLIAKDSYDFKDDLVKESKVRPSADYEKMSTLGKIGTIAADTIVHPRGFTTLPSRIGSAFIGKDGRPVKIDLGEAPFKKGGKVNKPKQSSASKRGDGIAQRGKTRGRVV
jgi:hypothetical protein